MRITEVRIRFVDDGRLKAFVSITIDDCFAIRGLKIMKSKGLFVAMPSRWKPDGTFQDLVYPINGETRDLLEQTILRAYYEQGGENESGFGARIKRGPVPRSEKAQRPFPPEGGSLQREDLGAALGLAYAC